MPLREKAPRRTGRVGEETIVPNVVGKDQQAAMTMLENAGFKVQVLSVKPTNSGQSGKVVDEQPAGGTRAPDGSTATISIGSG
jgi:eukaryotic-like serine/threonine-protein kinase